MADHNIATMDHAGLCVTINSDDPAYFGGYINENFAAVQRAFDLDQAALVQYATRSVDGARKAQQGAHQHSGAIGGERPPLLTQLPTFRAI